MSGLTKERDTLTEKLRTYRALFDARSQLLKEVQGAQVFSLYLKRLSSVSNKQRSY